MDVLRLDKTTFKPDLQVAKHSELIWTERYTPAGDFVLKTPRIEETLSQISEESLISLRDSREVMVVESCLIEETSQEGGGHELVVRGRSFEVFNENRDNDTNLPDHTPWTPDGVAENWFIPGAWSNTIKYTTAEAVGYLLWIGNVATLPIPPIGVVGSYLDTIPQFAVSDSTGTDGVETKRRVPMTQGRRYDRILELLEKKDLGIRAIRPPSSQGLILRFNGDTPGEPVRTAIDNVENRLLLDIYKGVDRTIENSATPVVFDYARDLKDPSYLRSIVDYKNVAIVTSPIGRRVVLAPRLNGVEPIGLDRRSLFVDASNLNKVVGDTTAAQMLDQKGLQELKKHNKRRFFDFEVIPNSRYRYGTSYNLGDKVTAQGQYGFKETMVVSEYIRTEDRNGERGYPTLVRPDE